MFLKSLFSMSQSSSSSNGFVHAFSYIFFSFRDFFFKIVELKEDNFSVHQNYAIKKIGHRACLRENGDLSLSHAKPY